MQLLGELAELGPHTSLDLKMSRLQDLVGLRTLEALEAWDPDAPAAEAGRLGLEDALGALDEAYELASSNDTRDPTVGAFAAASVKLARWLVRIGDGERAHAIAERALGVALRQGTGDARRTACGR